MRPSRLSAKLRPGLQNESPNHRASEKKHPHAKGNLNKRGSRRTTTNTKRGPKTWTSETAAPAARPTPSAIQQGRTKPPRTLSSQSQRRRGRPNRRQHQSLCTAQEALGNIPLGASLPPAGKNAATLANLKAPDLQIHLRIRKFAQKRSEIEYSAF